MDKLIELIRRGLRAMSVKAERDVEQDITQTAMIAWVSNGRLVIYYGGEHEDRFLDAVAGWCASQIQDPSPKQTHPPDADPAETAWFKQPKGTA